MQILLISRIVQLGLTVLLIFSISGCGRIYHIKGKVVVIIGAEQTVGRIEEVTGKFIPDEGTPVAGAIVKLIHKLDSQKRPVKRTIWQKSDTTDAAGLFEIRDYANPVNKALVGLEISKMGYETLYTTYWDYGNIEPQVFFVVLVPAKQ